MQWGTPLNTISTLSTNVSYPIIILEVDYNYTTAYYSNYVVLRSGDVVQKEKTEHLIVITQVVGLMLGSSLGFVA